ncbi:MAG: glycosyltransferase, partial [Bdellovibrionales bacterium]|nr:glycosyltransferase [Bdellovibrionales bacterium]
MALISVILPTYNRLSLLKRAIGSVLAQSHPNWELIVVDDGSEDGTAQWLKTDSELLALGNRLRVIRVDNGGVSRARNLGVSGAKGEWLTFLDSDDEWLPEKLQMQMTHASLNPHHLLIHGEEIWVRNGERVNPCKHHQKFGGRIFAKCLPLCVISPSTVMIHRDLFQEVGLFNEEFPVCEDYELWLRICSRFEVGFISDPLIIKYGGHEDQLSKRYKAMDYWRVKALAPYLTNFNITDRERTSVREVLEKKCRILLQGYEKHNNMENYDEVSAYLHRCQVPK